MRLVPIEKPLRRNSTFVGALLSDFSHSVLEIRRNMTLSIFFMILCIMVIVGGMARFSPALIYRRFIFETRSGGGAVPLTAYNTGEWVVSG